jgi:hypothetical protein
LNGIRQSVCMLRIEEILSQNKQHEDEEKEKKSKDEGSDKEINTPLQIENISFRQTHITNEWVKCKEKSLKINKTRIIIPWRKNNK